VTDFDSRPETKKHIERVRWFIGRVVRNLGERAASHDATKLVEPELTPFNIATPKLAELEYGSPEYRQSWAELRPALDHHFAHNDHHPEHFSNGVRGMSLMALMEMLCDWRAASERVKQRLDDPDKVSSFERGLAYNQERFGYSDELADILMNTARELDLL
jgi:hypothetical protein